MQYDIHNNVGDVVGLNIQTIDSDTTTLGPIIDTLGFESIEFIPITGTITDGSFVFSILQSDLALMTDAAAVPAAEVLGAVTIVAANDNITDRIGSVGKKRYKRLQVVSTLTSSGGVMGAVAIQGNPHRTPVA
jgi:hypothetical protein